MSKGRSEGWNAIVVQTKEQLLQSTKVPVYKDRPAKSGDRGRREVPNSLNLNVDHAKWP